MDHKERQKQYQAENMSKTALLVQVQQYAEQLLKGLCDFSRISVSLNPIFGLSVENTDSMGTDPYLKIGDSGVELYAYLADVDNTKSGQNEFGIGIGVITPGCRTLSNGDPGYPDDYDFHEKTVTTNPDIAAYEAVKLALETALTGSHDGLQEAKAYAEIREHEQDLPL